MKSHFTFSKQQQNGIYLLIFLIIVLQVVCFFIPVTSEDVLVNTEAFNQFQKEIDSLHIIEIENRKPKIYPFNPNYITDYKGAGLGLTNKEIDRLLAFRSQGKWINSIKQFQEVTEVSDSILNRISIYFKFPDWVENQNKDELSSFVKNDVPKTFAQKQDLNTTTAKQLQTINGIGKYYSERIIKFRNKFVGGLIADVQLQDVYGLTPEVIEKITKEFTVKSPRVFEKLQLNKAAKEDLVTIQHIDYNLAHHIIEYRQLHEGFESLNELTKVKDFPVNKIEIIKLYLSLD